MAAANSGKEQLKVFISYSRQEIDVANAIADALETRGMDVLIDRRDLPYGEQWQHELADLIRNADAVVWLVSQSSCVSRWCNWELGEVMRLGKRLVPIAVDKLSSKDLPEAIGKIQLLPHEGTFAMERHLDTLQYVLETNSAWLKEHTRLADRARQWIAKGRNSALLLRGAALRDAQSWLDERRPTAPMPSAETLELLLASRRAKAKLRAWLVAGPALATIALVLAYTSVMWVGARKMPDTNFALGDILNSDGEPGFDGTYFACKMRCIFNAFGQRCVAFTYDQNPALVTPAEQGGSKNMSKQAEGREISVAPRRCYPKYAADFFWNPSRTGDVPTTTEIMLVLSGERPDPKESPYLMRWYRTLSGTPIDVSDMLQRGDIDYINDDRTARTNWNLRASACQQVCIDLGEKCKGFSHTSLPNRCELFRSVKGVTRDTYNNRPVFIPGTISGCDDPNAAIEPETKQPECPPRNTWMLAPPRAPAPPPG